MKHMAMHDHEPDAPGVLIPGTPPSSLRTGAPSRSAQELGLQLERAEHDFSHTIRERLAHRMTAALRVAELDRKERAIWERVESRWRARAARQVEAFSAALHPRYMEWRIGDPAPHGAKEAIERVMAGPTMLHHELAPRDFFVCGPLVVVHYESGAAIADQDGERHVDGFWTEVYEARGDEWLLVSISGGENPARDQR